RTLELELIWCRERRQDGPSLHVAMAAPATIAYLWLAISLPMTSAVSRCLPRTNTALLSQEIRDSALQSSTCGPASSSPGWEYGTSRTPARQIRGRSVRRFGPTNSEYHHFRSAGATCWQDRTS